MSFIESIRAQDDSVSAGWQRKRRQDGSPEGGSEGQAVT